MYFTKQGFREEVLCGLVTAAVGSLRTGTMTKVEKKVPKVYKRQVVIDANGTYDNASE